MRPGEHNETGKQKSRRKFIPPARKNNGCSKRRLPSPPHTTEQSGHTADQQQNERRRLGDLGYLDTVDSQKGLVDVCPFGDLVLDDNRLTVGDNA
jgi:hypothetical protein